jgi:hypothetical protein
MQAGGMGGCKDTSQEGRWRAGSSRPGQTLRAGHQHACQCCSCNIPTIITMQVHGLLPWQENLPYRPTMCDPRWCIVIGPVCITTVA